MSLLLAGLIPGLPERPRPTPGYRPQPPELPPNARARPKPALEGTIVRSLRVEAVHSLGVNGAGGRRWACTCLVPSGPGGAPCGKACTHTEHDLLRADGSAATCGARSCKLTRRRLLAASKRTS